MTNRSARLWGLCPRLAIRWRACVDSRVCPGGFAFVQCARVCSAPGCRGWYPEGITAREDPCACRGGLMTGHNLAAGGEAVSVTGGNLTLVVIVAVVALLALAVAGWLVRDVLAASQGTAKMQEIAHAVQEGAAAYLRRQFRTLGVFVVLIFFVLLLLPADGAGVRWGRSLFFVVGAVFSALTGFTGMSLTVRGNGRGAAAGRHCREERVRGLG